MAPSSRRSPRRKTTRDEAKGGKGVKGKRKGGKEERGKGCLSLTRRGEKVSSKA